MLNQKSIFKFAQENLGIKPHNLNFRFPIEILDDLLKKFYESFELTSFLIQANNSISNLKLKKISNSYLLQAPIEGSNPEQFYLGLSDKFSFLLLFEDCGVNVTNKTRSKVFLSFDDIQIKHILEYFYDSRCQELDEGEKKLLNKLRQVKVTNLDPVYLAKFQEELLVNALKDNHETKERKILEAISFSDEYIVMTDIAGQIKEKNKNFQSKFCYDQVLNKITDLISPKMFKQSSERALKGLSWQVEQDMLIGKNKETYLVNCYPSKDSRERIEGLVYAFKDITNLRKLNNVNKQLVERLRSKNIELSEANNRLLDADRIKMELLSVVSHELKTPVSTIIGFSELIENRDEDRNTVKAFAREIGSSAKRLNKLLSDYLDVASNQFGVDLEKLNTNAVNLSNLITMLYETQIQKYSGINFQFEISKVGYDPVIISEASNLQKLFLNVLDNAMKYSPQGGKISVKLFNDGNNVTVSIADEGIGINSEQAKRVFEPFYRTDNSLTREFSGVGLGLSVSKKIVEIYNGSIWCEKGLEKGTVFYITLPVNPAKAAENKKIKNQSLKFDFDRIQ